MKSSLIKRLRKGKDKELGSGPSLASAASSFVIPERTIQTTLEGNVNLPSDPRESPKASLESDGLFEFPPRSLPHQQSGATSLFSGTTAGGNAISGLDRAEDHIIE